MRLRVAILAMALVSPLGGQTAHAAVGITISNFRFCQLPACTPAHQAYVADGAGAPTGGVVNPAVAINVRPGETVTWTYDDLMCDAISGCFHQVKAVNGAFFSVALLSRTNRTFSYTVPAGTSKGLIPFFCPFGNGLHARAGMTSALNVV